MARVFKAKLRFKAGGTMDLATGIMSGGVTLGHYMSSVRVNAERPILTSRISSGPAVQDTDDDDVTVSIEVEAAADSVAARNLQQYAATGGYVQVTLMDGQDMDSLAKYGAFKFGNFGGSSQKEVATQTVTLVGTNSVLEAAWIADQNDLPSSGSGGGS